MGAIIVVAMLIIPLITIHTVKADAGMLVAMLITWLVKRKASEVKSTSLLLELETMFLRFLQKLDYSNGIWYNG